MNINPEWRYPCVQCGRPVQYISTTCAHCKTVNRLARIDWPLVAVVVGLLVVLIYSALTNFGSPT